MNQFATCHFAIGILPNKPVCHSLTKPWQMANWNMANWFLWQNADGKMACGKVVHMVNWLWQNCVW